MISLLTENSSLRPDIAGRRGSELSIVGHGGLPTVPTVLIERNAFWEYANGTLPSRLFDEAFAKISNATGASDFLICCSPTHDAIWCEKDLRTEHTVSALRNAVEHLFRSMMTARSRADRATLKLPEEDAAPAILIQKFPAATGRLLSRHAVTGQPTTETNWTDNINNALPQRVAESIALSQRAECLLGKPLQLFLDTEGPAIASVGPSIMTVPARLVALVDLLERRAINETTLVKQLDPSMFGHLQGFELHPDHTIATSNGIPASPGQVLGRVSLSRFKRQRVRKGILPPILFLIEATPDDVLDVETAAASAGSIGGLTSHLAVMCRGMGRPCVVGTQIQIDDIRREVILKTGLRIGENTTVVLDGTIGVVAFSDSPDLLPKYSVVWHESGVRKAVLRAIQNVSADKAAFADLSIDEQSHIALLKYRLREFGML